MHKGSLDVQDFLNTLTCVVSAHTNCCQSQLRVPTDTTSKFASSLHKQPKPHTGWRNQATKCSHLSRKEPKSSLQACADTASTPHTHALYTPASIHSWCAGC
jgi:hypothetical protein